MTVLDFTMCLLICNSSISAIVNFVVRTPRNDLYYTVCVPHYNMQWPWLASIICFSAHCLQIWFRKYPVTLCLWSSARDFVHVNSIHLLFLQFSQVPWQSNYRYLSTDIYRRQNLLKPLLNTLCSSISKNNTFSILMIFLCLWLEQGSPDDSVR